MTLPAVSQDIADMLDADVGLALTKATDLFIMEWGKDVDAQVLIMDSNGVPSDLKETYAQPTFQVLVRGERNAGGIAAHVVIQAVHEFLIAQSTREINGRTYLQFEPMGEPMPLGRDENDRHQFTANYFTFRNPS